MIFHLGQTSHSSHPWAAPHPITMAPPLSLPVVTMSPSPLLLTTSATELLIMVRIRQFIRNIIKCMGILATMALSHIMSMAMLPHYLTLFLQPTSPQSCTALFLLFTMATMATMATMHLLLHTLHLL